MHHPLEVIELFRIPTIEFLSIFRRIGLEYGLEGAHQLREGSIDAVNGKIASKYTPAESSRKTEIDRE